MSALDTHAEPRLVEGKAAVAVDYIHTYHYAGRLHVLGGDWGVVEVTGEPPTLDPLTSA